MKASVSCEKESIIKFYSNGDILFLSNTQGENRLLLLTEVAVGLLL